MLNVQDCISGDVSRLVSLEAKEGLTHLEVDIVAPFMLMITLKSRLLRQSCTGLSFTLLVFTVIHPSFFWKTCRYLASFHSSGRLPDVGDRKASSEEETFCLDGFQGGWWHWMSQRFGSECLKCWAGLRPAESLSRWALENSAIIEGLYKGHCLLALAAWGFDNNPWMLVQLSFVSPDLLGTFRQKGWRVKAAAESLVCCGLITYKRECLWTFSCHTFFGQQNQIFVSKM